ncbi:MAG: hypothetical protein QY309_05100 [Cyclobacteriaceae bacterium]|nr:MAG: hypothetical protein QY309_05100 [Cyclobacteriaceae bacterium]
MSFFSRVHERVLRKFVANSVDFVLIGGHASIIHGVRRTTSDLDILVRPTQENGQRVVRAFQNLGVDCKNIHAEDFLVEQVFSFGMEPDAVDILNFSKGISLEDIFENAVTRKIDDLRIKVIDIRDLITNKEKIGRDSEKGLVDQQDILALKRILKMKK